MKSKQNEARSVETAYMLDYFIEQQVQQLETQQGACIIKQPRP